MKVLYTCSVEKQIEEMAKDLKEIETDVWHILINETFSYVKEHKKYNLKKDFSNAHTKIFEELTAEEMFNKGYRKLPEDSVVLSREQFKILCEDKVEITHLSIDEEFKKECEYEIEQACKETAEKIFNEFYAELKEFGQGRVITYASVCEIAKKHNITIPRETFTSVEIKE